MTPFISDKVDPREDKHAKKNHFGQAKPTGPYFLTIRTYTNTSAEVVSYDSSPPPRKILDECTFCSRLCQINIKSSSIFITSSLNKLWIYSLFQCHVLVSSSVQYRCSSPMYCVALLI